MSIKITHKIEINVLAIKNLLWYHVIMTLKEWLEKHNIQQKIFARKIGITARYINSICRGSYIPSRKLAEKIMIETQGKVTIIETLGLK